jgi:hypothetical protein
LTTILLGIVLEGKIVVDLDIKWEWTKPQNLDDGEPVRLDKV